MMRWRNCIVAGARIVHRMPLMHNVDSTVTYDIATTNTIGLSSSFIHHRSPARCGRQRNTYECPNGSAEDGTAFGAYAADNLWEI